MTIRKTILMFGLIALVFAYSGIAQAANTISGSLWHVPESVVTYGGTGGSPASIPGTSPDVTFDVYSPFNFTGSGVQVGTWLASSSAFNIVENTAGTLNSYMDNGIYGTILDFTGFVTVTNGMTFTVTHDDGLTLSINGITVINAPGPTAPATGTYTYTGTSGTFAFELAYAECCGGPAVLQIDLPFTNSVPEPATLILLGVGLVGLAGAKKKLKK
jgi:hypothetical protein